MNGKQAIVPMAGLVLVAVCVLLTACGSEAEPEDQTVSTRQVLRDRGYCSIWRQGAVEDQQYPLRQRGQGRLGCSSRPGRRAGHRDRAWGSCPMFAERRAAVQALDVEHAVLGTGLR